MGNKRELSNKEKREICNAAYHVRRLHSLASTQQKQSFSFHLQGLVDCGYKVEKEEEMVSILTPYAASIPNAFHPSIFVDCTATSDHKTIIHASCVTTTSTIILVELVLCKTEDTSGVRMLLEQFVKGAETITFMTDEGDGPAGFLL